MATDCLSTIDQFLLYVSATNQCIDDSSFALSIWIKGCSSKYPVNIASMQRIQKYYPVETKCMQTLIRNGAISDILKVLKQNDDNFELLCCGYFRKSATKNIIPIDIVNIIDRISIVKCMQELRDVGTTVLTNMISFAVCGFHTISLIDKTDRGAIDFLIKSFKKTQSFQVKTNIIRALNDIAANCSEFKDSILKCEMLKCMKQIRHTTGNHDASSKVLPKIISCQMTTHFIQFAQDAKYPALQYEVLWILINLTSGPVECTKHVLNQLNAGAHNLFIDLLQSPLYEVQFQAMWILGNIAGGGKEFRDLLLSNNNLLPNIISICSSGFDKQFVTNFNKAATNCKYPLSQLYDVLVITSWTLSNLCRRALPTSQQQLTDIIKCFRLLLKRALTFHEIFQKEKNEIIRNAGWGFSYLSAFDQQLLFKMENYGILQQFVDLMDYADNTVRPCALRLIGNILTGSDEIVRKCLNLGILNKYYKLITTTAKEKEIREICWSLSNITAGPLEDKMLVLNSKLPPVLINLLKHAAYLVGTEALWTFCNLIGNDEDESNKAIFNRCVELGIIDALSVFLQSQSCEAHKNDILITALDCIETILWFGNNDDEPNRFTSKFEGNGIVGYIKDLQNHNKIKNEEIYEACTTIIEMIQM